MSMGQLEMNQLARHHYPPTPDELFTNRTVVEEGMGCGHVYF